MPGKRGSEVKIIKTKRLSHCVLCGKRLSLKTPTGDIHWNPGQVDDEGIYCTDCYAVASISKKKKKPPTKS